MALIRFINGKCNELYIFDYKDYHEIIFNTVSFASKIKPFRIAKLLFNNGIPLNMYPLEVKIL